MLYFSDNFPTILNCLLYYFVNYNFFKKNFLEKMKFYTDLIWS